MRGRSCAAGQQQHGREIYMIRGSACAGAPVVLVVLWYAIHDLLILSMTMMMEPPLHRPCNRKLFSFSTQSRGDEESGWHSKRPEGDKKSNIYFVGVWKKTEKNQKHLKKQKKPYSREYVESLGKKIFMSNRNPTVFFFLFPILPTSPVNFSFISALRLLFEPERPNQLLVNKNIFSKDPAVFP